MEDQWIKENVSNQAGNGADNGALPPMPSELLPESTLQVSASSTNSNQALLSKPAPVTDPKDHLQQTGSFIQPRSKAILNPKMTSEHSNSSMPQSQRVTFSDHGTSARQFQPPPQSLPQHNQAKADHQEHPFPEGTYFPKLEVNGVSAESSNSQDDFRIHTSALSTEDSSNEVEFFDETHPVQSEGPEEHQTLLELGEETMAQAMLIFLLADLRILSATGRIRTKFEHLALDSDRSPRLSSQDYAGFYNYEESNGVTASHIMAILLVEILREAEDVRNRKQQASRPHDPNATNRRGGKKKHKNLHQQFGEPALLSPWGSGAGAGDAGGGVNAKKVFKRDIRAANGLPSLLHCYNEMLSDDVSPSISRVSRLLYPLDEDILQSQQEIEAYTEANFPNALSQPQGLIGRQDDSNRWNLSNPPSIESVDLNMPLDNQEQSEQPPTPATGDYTAFSAAAGSSSNIPAYPSATPASAMPVVPPNTPIPSVVPIPSAQPFGMTPNISTDPRIMSNTHPRSRSASMSLVQLVSNSNHNSSNTPFQQSGHYSRFQRRLSASFQPAHFDPNVELDDDDDDSVQFQLSLNLQGLNLQNLRLHNLNPSKSAIEDDKANENAVSESPRDRNKTATTEGAPPGDMAKPSSTPMLKSSPSIDSEDKSFKGESMGLTASERRDQSKGTGTPHHLKLRERIRKEKEKIRERMEKAIPMDTLAMIAQNFPKSPAAREEQRMNEIAQVHNRLLDWDTTGDEIQADDVSELGMKESLDGGFPETKVKGKPTVKPSPISNTDPASTVEENRSGHFRDKDSAVHPETPHFHDSTTIRRLILQALDSRDFWRLGFIKSFFKEGTVSHVLANSRAEMVWLSDWHTQYECTYALSIDREKGKVLLAFRGAYTERDWRHIVDWYDTATSNPVKEDYPNRAKHIRVHSGFHKYLFRVRKDTGTTKYDEIAAKLDHYCKLTGGDLTKITITGHSLGAALAAIFSLYASTEERFTSNARAIECVTFGAPCIGNWRFAGAVKHQEDVGKLRIAKFHVKGDSVPHLPPALIRTSSRGAQYWHSGIDVSLPYIRKGKIFQSILGGQPKPKLTYWNPEKESYFGSLFRQFREYYVWNLPLRFWRFALFHTLVEHKKRMDLVSKSDPNSLLATCTLKELYDMREDLNRRWREKRMRKKTSDARR